MDVLLVCDEGVERHEIEELPELLERRDAVVWVDIPVCDEQAVNVLSGVFGFHPIAVRDCVERNHVSKVHIYPDYAFSVLNAPLGQAARRHVVEHQTSSVGTTAMLANPSIRSTSLEFTVTRPINAAYRRAVQRRAGR